MSNYITLAEARVAIDRIDSVFTDADLQSTINNIEAIIDANLDKRYVIPVTNATAILFLKELVISILRFKTFTKFADSEDLPKGVELDYKDAMKIVEKLGRHQMSLPGQAESSTKRPGSIVTNLDTPVFSSDELEYY